MSSQNNISFARSVPIKAIFIGVVFILGIFAAIGLTGKNNDQDWQVKQSLGGEVEIISKPGYYYKGFSTVWTYPKYIQFEYLEKDTRGDESVGVIFNDGSSAKFSTMIRLATPSIDEKRRNFHQQFKADEEAIARAVRSHLINCLRSTGPLMSASEHQTARKAEFNQIVQDQLMAGLYEMRRVNKKVEGQVDAKGEPITVLATEILMGQDGRPLVSQKSPLADLDIKVVQFSVLDSPYDAKAMEQFAIKKEAFLSAEGSKAQREKEVQQTLMVQQKGLREKAEIEAEANKKLAAATINANQEKTVAETNAQKLASVALQTKIAAETFAAQEKAVAELNAQRQLEVAKLERQAAEENAKKEITLAESKKQSLALGGAISEKDRVLATINADRDVRVAAELSKVAVPSTVINSGSSASGSSGNSELLNLVLLKSMGVLPQAK